MKFKNINYGDGVELRGYLFEESAELDEKWKKRPTVVVCPGGGYWICSYREADIVATQFLARGFNAFVFTYSLGEKAVFPRPLVELSVAMKDIRENASEWLIDPDKIAVCGFSAGGHLCASLGTLWNDAEIIEKSGCKNGENKPNALILGYPVISTSWIEKDNSLQRLIGDSDFELTKKKLNMQNNVGKQTPPSFIFHTYNDGCVPVEDSLVFAAALAENDIPFDLHIFTNGGHGMSVGNDTVGCNEPEYGKWVGMAGDWLWRTFGGREDIKKTDLFDNRMHFIK